MTNFKKNVRHALLAQLISLLVSCTMSMIAPKFISLVDYSYWQLFIFYNSLIVFLNFGYNQGLYLKFGGLNKQNISRLRIKNNLINVVAIQLLTASVVVIYAVNSNIDTNKLNIIYMLAIGIVVNNISDFFCYVLQIVNCIKEYSKITITYNLIYLLSIFCVFILSDKGIVSVDYLTCIVFYTISRVIGLLIGFKETYLLDMSILNRVRLAKKNFFRSINIVKDGFYLSASDLMSFLVLGINRIAIEHIWGLTTFGLVSFSLQLCNFLMVFFKQIALVLFPYLRNSDFESNKYIYLKYNKYFDIISPWFYLFIVPIQFFVFCWLPGYSQACQYLSILFPICVYEAKMQIFGSTYLKAYRKERLLLLINLTTLALSFLGILLFGILYPKFEYIVMGMVACIIFRSLFAECLINSVLYNRIEYIDNILLLVITFIFNILFYCFDTMIAIQIYSAALAFYTFFSYIINNRRSRSYENK